MPLIRFSHHNSHYLSFRLLLPSVSSPMAGKTGERFLCVFPTRLCRVFINILLLSLTFNIFSVYHRLLIQKFLFIGGQICSSLLFSFLKWLLCLEISPPSTMADKYSYFNCSVGCLNTSFQMIMEWDLTLNGIYSKLPTSFPNNIK